MHDAVAVGEVFANGQLRFDPIARATREANAHQPRKSWVFFDDHPLPAGLRFTVHGGNPLLFGGGGRFVHSVAVRKLIRKSPVWNTLAPAHPDLLKGGAREFRSDHAPGAGHGWRLRGSRRAPCSGRSPAGASSAAPRSTRRASTPF